MKLDPMLERCLDVQDLDIWPEEANATTLAKLHHQRWGIERAFLHPTMHLRREVHTLSYPPMAPSRLPAAQKVAAL